MDTLRLSLLLLGLLVVGGIVVADQLRRRRLRQLERRRRYDRLDATVEKRGVDPLIRNDNPLDDGWEVGPVRVKDSEPVDDQLEELRGLKTGEAQTTELSESDTAAPEPLLLTEEVSREEYEAVVNGEAASATESSGDSEQPPEPQPLILTLMADGMWRGSDLQQTFEREGLSMNAAGFFAANEPPVNVANILNPGYFELDSLDSLETPGLLLWAPFDSHPDATQIRGVVALGQRMAQQLGGKLCNQRREPLDKQGLAEIIAPYIDNR